MVANPYAKFKMGNIVGGAPNFTIRNYMSTTKIDGVNKLKVGIDDNYSGQMAVTALSQGLNPNYVWKWLIGVQATDDTSTITARVFVKITYYVKLYDRKLLGPS